MRPLVCNKPWTLKHNMWKCSTLVIVLVFYLVSQPGTAAAVQCSRYPPNTLTPKSPVDENFVLSITGNVQTYILGQSYNISLQAHNGRRFISAKVVLENSEGDRVFSEDLGRLDVIDDIETQYSLNCSNMIETTNMNYKTRVDMVWVAPSSPENGCVLIRATVLQHRDVWFMDDGALTKQICEESVDDIQSQRRDEEGKPCCACDEARYEIIFEGNWSRNLHPKDYPAKGWLTRFSDLVGAAHTSDYRFWDAGVLASPEMQEFAEHGSSRGLERELNRSFKEEKIRTILKARGPAYPYMNIPSVASIRVDPWHHQMSIASKIVPSPDWIVGVAGFELCLSNCTWLEQKSINLYPWDIGTDAGPSYTSPDQPQLPADVIRRMRSDFPADIRSPFFDETGLPMRPMATLTIRRQRLYERKCEDDDSNNDEGIARECRTHPWSQWSECSTNCGQGTQSRIRVFKQPDVAEIYNCGTIVENRQDRPCTGPCANSDMQLAAEEVEEEPQYGMERLMKSGRINAAANCRMGEWGEWSPCNATCGAGLMSRQRELLDVDADEECLELEERFEHMPCFNRKCSDPNKSPIPIIDNTRNIDYNRNFLVDRETQPNSNDMFSRFNNPYDGSGRSDASERNNYRAQQNRYGSRNPSSARELEFENTDGEQPLNYPFKQGQRGSGRRQWSKPFNRYPDNAYDNNGTPDEPYDFNRQRQPPMQYNQFNAPNGQELGEEDVDAQDSQMPLDDTLESLGEPYTFPAENLKQEPPFESYATPESKRKQTLNKNGYFQYLNSPVNDQSADNELTPAAQRNPHSGIAGKHDLSEAMQQKVPQYCYQPLKIVQCADTRVIANFWFYNYCADECMLYAATICDHNTNRFTSLEQCEEQCAIPARKFPRVLQQQQKKTCPGEQQRGKRQWNR